MAVNKKCSCCGGKLVYVTGLSYKIEERHCQLTVVPFSREDGDKIKETYVCAECGHIESFVKLDSQFMELVIEKSKNP